MADKAGIEPGSERNLARVARPTRMPDSPIVAVVMVLGPDLPTVRIGEGPRSLVYLPGLSLYPGHPTGNERRMALSGWQSLLDRYTIYRVGRRVRPVGTTLAQMADDVAGAIDELGAPVDLMGASTGGLIAIHVAATRPDLVRRLVLVTTGTQLEPEARRMAETVMEAARGGRWRTVFATVLPIAGASRGGRFGYKVFGWLLGPRL